MSVADNLNRVREQIQNAAIKAGRNPNEIRLVAVAKTFPAERVVEAYHVGARDIGENRVEEASDKIPSVNALIGEPQPLRWHLIGHLQRRKARDAAQLFSMIQSVDTVRLAETLNRHAAAVGKTIPILLEVNVGADPNKFGLAPEPRPALYDQVGQIVALANLQVQGLMTIGPLVTSAEDARPVFRGLRELRDALTQQFPQAQWHELSMGMSDDFAVAIDEGATIVRVGRAIFGERP